jgi:hypothetical protein
MKRWRIRFVSGTVDYVDGYRAVVENGVLKIRTSHDTQFSESWKCFPLHNIEMYETV